ncbi:hypothetical protein, partial [Streptomyces sp. SID12501]
MQATSNTVTLQRAPWTVALEADKTTFRAGEQVTFTAAANQDVFGTNANYRIWVVDLTAGQKIGS